MLIIRPARWFSSVRTTAFIVAGFLALSASAQLPQVQVPGAGVPELPGQVIPEVAGRVNPLFRELTQARALRAERLLDNHRELDRSPPGDLIVRAQVVAIDITEEALARALKERFLVLRIRDLAELAVKITVLQTPAGMSATRGLKRLRKLDPDGSYDFNHVYLDSGEAGTGLRIIGRATAESAGAGAGAGGGVNRAGLIDGGVDTTHEALAKTRVHRFGCDGEAVPSIHGTAVAALLASRSAIGELFAADVYCESPTGGSIDAVAASFGWLARERVGVINVSLVGPRNALLERVVKTMVSRGHLIVAAVGNDGPAAPPLYPAAFDGVVGVTAVDANHHVLMEACRGKHVDFAALGLSQSAAAGTANGYGEVRGTSFAAPIVTLLLSELATPDPLRRQQLLDQLTGRAADLGKPGRDNIYGAGEVGPPVIQEANK
jgi:subtilisin family serine protease